MNEAVDRINRAARDESESMFRDCCGSARWARLMSLARPFASEKELMKAAEAVWNDLPREDWLEAFSAHPKIGETKAPPTQQARSVSWSGGEQAGMSSASEAVKHKLADANRSYFDKFGFIFIVCASGKSAEEMLRLCRARMSNDRETEIAVAAAEQQKITEIRLRKLLSQ